MTVQGIKGSNYTEETNPLDLDVDGILLIKEINGANPVSRKTLFRNLLNTFLGETVKSGTYTPTLTGMVIGSGGTPTNTASYTYADGLLVVEGYIQFGTSGQTFPTNPTVTLPPGFAWLDVAVPKPIGRVRYVDSGTGWRYGVVLANTATTINFRGEDASSSAVTDTAISTTFPMVWAQNDGMAYSYTGRAQET